MFLYTYFWVNIHQILELCCVCGKSLATAALPCSVVQDRDVEIIVIPVMLCGRGACWSEISSVVACSAEPKTTETGARNKLMENCLSPLTWMYHSLKSCVVLNKQYTSSLLFVLFINTACSVCPSLGL